MKYTFWTLVIWAILAFTSCINGHGDSKENEPAFGWRTTGLKPNADELNTIGTGIQKITHVGNRLFAMDARVTATGKKNFQMFTTLQGDSTWDTLWLPNRVSPYCWYTDSIYLYVGTDLTGQVWRYDPKNNSWVDLLTNADSLFRVYSISEFKGHIIASLSSGWDTTKSPVLILQDNGKWLDINSKQLFAANAFHKGIEFNNVFYASTYDQGVWYWTPTDSTWHQLSNPPRSDVGGTAINAYPRGMAVFENELYIGYWNGGGIQKYLGNDSWLRVDSMFLDSLKNLKTTTASDIYSLATGGGHLFSAGYYSSNPTVYTGATEPKGWRKISRATYCPADSFQCLGTNVSDMDIVNDTLYAAAWDALLKFPLSDLDSGIIGAPAYPVGSSTTSLAKKIKNGNANAK